MKLTSEAFDVIRDRLIPATRIEKDSLVIADHQTIIQMANWLGFDTKVAEANLSKTLKANKLSDRGISTVDEHRFICKSLDDCLKVDEYLKKFEEDLAFLQSQFQQPPTK